MKPKIHLKNITDKTFWNCVTGIFILSFLIYGKSLTNKYAMDDEYIMVNNAQIHKGIKAIPEIFRTTYAYDRKANYEYRPIVKCTFAIEYSLFGEKPAVSHFINVFSYCILVSFLFFLVLKLFEDQHYLFSVIIAFLFLIHPLHSEVVLSLKNRDQLLSLMGCLLSLYFYLKYADTDKWINLIWGAFFMLFAMLSKKDALTFYAVIPAALYFFRKLPLKKYGWIALSYMPFLMVYGKASQVVKETAVRTMLQWENPLFIHSSFIQRIPTGIYSVWFYIKMFLLPDPLICYYGYNQVPILDYSSVVVWLVLGLILLLLFVIIKYFKSEPILVFGLIYFFITISMFMNIVKPVVGIVGERFEFIPSIGLCIVSSWLLFKVFNVPRKNLDMKWSNAKTGFFITLAIIGILFSGKSFSRNAAWKDAYTLYKTDAAEATESAHTHALLAASAMSKVTQNKKITAREKKAFVYEAEKNYLESIRILPDYVTSLSNLGMIYHTYLNKPEKGIPYLQRAVKLDTAYVEAYFNLAACYNAVKNYPEAVKNYQRVLELNPQFTIAYDALDKALAETKQYDKLIAVNQKAIDNGIELDLLYINIGNVYYMQGDTVKALPFLEKGISINENNPGLTNFLVDYYTRHNDPQKVKKYSALSSGIK